MKNFEAFDFVRHGAGFIFSNHTMKVMKKIKMVCLCFLLVFSVVAGLAPVRVVEATDVGFTTEPMVAAGFAYTVALRNDGTVWAWGLNESGQLGDRSNVNRNTPNQVQGLINIVAISAGSHHTVALRSDGTVLAWGRNRHGQLGDDTEMNSNAPVQVRGINNVISISAGAYHTVALRYDGTVWGWGMGMGYDASRNVIANSHTPRPVGLRDVIAITAGGAYTAVLRNDGTVWEWRHSIGNRVTDGMGIPMPVQGLSDVISISSTDRSGSMRSTFALDNDGFVWSWGDNSRGQLGDGSTRSRHNPDLVERLSNVIAISAGSDHVAALRSDGNVWTWGFNITGELGDISTRVRSSTIPMQVQDLSDITAISMGNGHSVAVQNDGTVWTWGANGNGQLGNGRFSFGHGYYRSAARVVSPDRTGYFNLFAQGTAPQPPPHPVDTRLAGYFSQASDIYNHDLAILAAELSAVAYGRRGRRGSYPEYIETTLRNLGFGNIRPVNYGYRYISIPNHHRVAFTLAHQYIRFDGVARPVVFVIIRGTTGDDQWHSNFDVGLKYDHYDHIGLSEAKMDLFSNLWGYLKYNRFDAQNGIIFVTGHSRGGGVANLLAAYLNTRPELVATRNLYAYTFASPNTTRRAREWPNIFNIVNAEDFVIHFPLTPGWEFQRHGRTLVLPTRGLVRQQEFRFRRDRVIEEFQRLPQTGGSLYPPFRPGGVGPVINNVIRPIYRLSNGSVHGYYNASNFAGGISWITPREFANIAANAASGSPLGSLTLVGMTLPARLTFPIPPSSYRRIASFLVDEAMFNQNWTNVLNLQSAHCELLYLAWMRSIPSYDQSYRHFILPIEGTVHIYGGLISVTTRAIRIGSPVDVRIYDSNNRLVGRVANHVIDTRITYDGIYIEADGYVTYIHLNVFDSYTVRITATDYGTMTYTISDIDIFSLDVVEQIEFEDVKLYPGREFTTDITDPSDARLFVVEDGEVVGEINEDGTENIWVPTIPTPTPSPVLPPPQLPDEPQQQDDDPPPTQEDDPPPPRPVIAPPINNPQSNWAREYLRRAAELGLIPTTLQGAHIDYTLPITRAEFAGVSVMLYAALTGRPALPSPSNPFVDTNDIYVLRAQNNYLMVGTASNRFTPNRSLTREEGATATARAYVRSTNPLWTIAMGMPSFSMPSLFADHNQFSSWAIEPVYFLVSIGGIHGTGANRFTPSGGAMDAEGRQLGVFTREQALAMAVRLYGR